MKKSLILFAATLMAVLSSASLALPAGAQELTVTYRVTFNPDSPELIAQAGGDAMMEFVLNEVYSNLVLNYQLVYKNGESELRVVPSDEKQTVEIMNQEIDLRQFAAIYENTYTYKDHNEGIILDKIQMPGRNILVTDEIKSEDYVVQEDGGIRVILRHVCRKAYSEKDNITVWFTADYDVKNEPIDCGLEGLILEIDDPSMTYIATNILESADHDPVRPEAKKTMTRAEFDAKFNK
ncbi:MAG: GLPGLI family protein [Bacteroidales bacterium]|nr:GLPGLI family protein [Bacteroidales bacterium]